MAFPAATYTDGVSALTALENKVASIGMTSAVLDQQAFVAAFLANHLDDPVVLNKIGYQNGKSVGGTVTQATSKSTGVALNKLTGQITMNAAALAADTTVSFTLTAALIAAGDILILNHISGGTAGSYLLNAQAAAGSASINVRNITAGSLSEAIVIGYAVIKGAAD